jgi:predicted nucleotidyltransferase component of viral defense system
MFEPQYLQQVKLLLEILPAIDRFPSLALHGGTAINLFYRPLPRLSVDIDLTWTNAGSRAHDLRAIKEDLRSLQKILQKDIPQSQLRLNETQFGIYKLYCQKGRAQVKVEVNTVNRGLLEPTQRRVLHPVAQELLERFCEVQMVGYGQLFGGKCVAALDRQHPRDVFDVRELLNRVCL